MKNNKVAIVPLGEDSKEVSQVLANETSRRILDLISDEPMSAMHIAYKLDLAINTAQYNLEKLEKVGLIEVERVDKSRKGRDMKIYTPTNKIIAIVPKNVKTAGVLEALKGIIPLVLLAILFAVGVDFVAYSPGYGSTSIESIVPAESFAAPQDAMMNVAEYEESDDAAKSVMAGAAELEYEMEPSGLSEARAATPPATPELILEEDPRDLRNHPGFWAFIGAILIIIAAFARIKTKSL